VLRLGLGSVFGEMSFADFFGLQRRGAGCAGLFDGVGRELE